MSEQKETLKRFGGIIAKVFGMENVSVTQKDGDDAIESYFGLIHFLTVTGFKNEQKISKKVTFKIGQSKKGPKFEKVLRSLYKREIYFYRILLPIFSNVTKSNAITPECYYLEENSEPLIVLQDMRQIGYKRYRHRSFNEIDHVVISLQTLAKFHAMTIVGKEESLAMGIHNVSQQNTPTFPVEYDDNIKDSFVNRLHLFKNSPHEHVFKSLISKYDTFLSDSTSHVKCLVYGHGDFWTENILFKYENTRPVSACLIDFQSFRALSPAQDFLHLLTTSVESSTRREHIEVFISSYLETLHYTLKRNDRHISYSRHDFIHDLKVVAPVIAAICFMSFSLWSGLDGDTLLRSKNVAKVDEIQLATDQFKEAIIQVVDDLNYFGFLHV